MLEKILLVRVLQVGRSDFYDNSVRQPVFRLLKFTIIAEAKATWNVTEICRQAGNYEWM